MVLIHSDYSPDRPEQSFALCLLFDPTECVWERKTDATGKLGAKPAISAKQS